MPKTKTRTKKQHDWTVTVLMEIHVSNALDKKGAIRGAKDLLHDEPREYLDEASFHNVKDLGESKTQYND